MLLENFYSEEVFSFQNCNLSVTTSVKTSDGWTTRHQIHLSKDLWFKIYQLFQISLIYLHSDEQGIGHDEFV